MKLTVGRVVGRTAGVLGWILVAASGLAALAFVAFWWSSRSLMADDGKPCVPSGKSLSPLLVGETVQMSAGQIQISDCIDQSSSFGGWTSSDHKVAVVSSSGLVKGLSPGVFAVAARKGEARLEVQGFVVPGGWTIAARPKSLVVKPGERALITVRARDKDGNELPPVPAQVEILGAPSVVQSVPPLLDKWRDESPTGAVAFRATHPGQLTLIASIGDRRVEIPVTIAATSP
jgi:hypothetical protein